MPTQELMATVVICGGCSGAACRQKNCAIPFWPVSGRLNLKTGGPGFYLFALEKTAHSPHYEYHKFDPEDAASHRRSIYRFIVRSQPDPFMTTLDCARLITEHQPRRTEDTDVTTGPVLF